MGLQIPCSESCAFVINVRAASVDCRSYKETSQAWTSYLPGSCMICVLHIAVQMVSSVVSRVTGSLSNNDGNDNDNAAKQ